MATLDLGEVHTCVIFSASGAVNCWGWNSHGQLGTGTTTDLATWQSESQDFDRDGCADWREVRTTTGTETSGGRRNPKLFWDFFDTPDGTNVRDKQVDQSDVDRVIARYGRTGDPTTDPLAPPPPPPAYSPAFDRTYVGPNPWNLGPPDGRISSIDMTQAVHQVGHSCVPPP